MGVLCANNKDIPIKFEFYSKNDLGGNADQLYGEMITTVNQIEQVDNLQKQF
jgi:hypothetical protein